MDEGITENDKEITKRLSNYHQIMNKEGKAPEDQMKVLPFVGKPIYTQDELEARMGLSKKYKYV